MNLAQFSAVISGFIAFLFANPYVALVLAAIVLLLIDPMLIGFLIVGVILWLVFHLPH